MDLGPIEGIRSVALLNAQRAKKDGTPNFEIDATERAGDGHASKQETPEQKAQGEEEFKPTPDPPAADPRPAEPEIDSEGQLNWFV